MGARVTAILLAMIAAGVVQAQVYRCKTPGSGTEYSQTPCGKDAQLLQDRNESIDTGPRTDPFDWIRKEQQAKRALESAQRGSVKPVPRSPACLRAIDTATRAIDAGSPAAAQLVSAAGAACGRPDIASAAGQLQNPAAGTKATAPNTKGPVQLVNCDTSGCWDTNGRRYNKAAGGTYFGPGGVACTQTAAGVICP